MANFMNLILTRWTISNSNKYDTNLLGNTDLANDNKFVFFLKLANWLENVLISALASKLHANALTYLDPVTELLDGGFVYIMTQRLPTK